VADWQYGAPSQFIPITQRDRAQHTHMPQKNRYTPHRETRNRVALTDGMRTTAGSLFYGHCQQLDALLCMVHADASISPNDTDHSRMLLQARVEFVNSGHSGPWAIDVRRSMLDWQIVVQVAAVEVYLKDALATFAQFNPELLRGRSVKQEWSYEQVLFSTEYDRTLHDFCARWSRGLVDSGGPVKWVKQLEAMGARGYDVADVDLMRLMWALRNLHVHHGGMPTSEFINQHRGYVEDHLDQPMGLSEWIDMRDASRRFVQTTDAFISKRLQDVMGAKARAASNRAGAQFAEKFQKRRREWLKAEPEVDLQRRLAANDRNFGERMFRQAELLQDESLRSLGEEHFEYAKAREEAIEKHLRDADAVAKKKNRNPRKNRRKQAG
jgi:hypothetical protein